jgi:hypothetical protein
MATIDAAANANAARRRRYPAAIFSGLPPSRRSRRIR